MLKMNSASAFIPLKDPDHKKVFKHLKAFFIILLLIISQTHAMNKTLKGTLIGLGAGIVVGSSIAFYNTYYFKEGYFTTDPLPLFISWSIIAPSVTVIGGVTGGIIGYKYQKKAESPRSNSLLDLRHQAFLYNSVTRIDSYKKACDATLFTSIFSIAPPSLPYSFSSNAAQASKDCPIQAPNLLERQKCHF